MSSQWCLVIELKCTIRNPENLTTDLEINSELVQLLTKCFFTYIEGFCKSSVKETGLRFKGQSVKDYKYQSTVNATHISFTAKITKSGIILHLVLKINICYTSRLLYAKQRTNHLTMKTHT